MILRPSAGVLVFRTVVADFIEVLGPIYGHKTEPRYHLRSTSRKATSPCVGRKRLLLARGSRDYERSTTL
jgi:hypothetical protein